MRLVRSTLRDALKIGASDIHLESVAAGLTIGTDLTFIPAEYGTWNFSVTGKGYYLGQSLKRANKGDNLYPQVVGSLSISY